jgi:formate dehydrogenase major subunit
VPDFQPTKPPDYQPPEGAKAQDALSGVDPFIMQADGKGWLYVPAGLSDGPIPTHYEPQESPVPNLLYGQQRNPSRQVTHLDVDRYQPSGDQPGSQVFPYALTTYRLTEHHTAGGMSRWLPYLSELQPEMFCEVSPELATETGLRHLGWATIVTARNAIEARVLVTDRMVPIRVHDRIVHQVGLPYHWGRNGISTGDAANELLHLARDPNVHIQEAKALTCDVRPGRRPRGADRLRLVEEYRRRAGVTERTGTEHRSTHRPGEPP